MNAQQKSLDFLGIQAKILGLQRYLVMRLRESRLPTGIIHLAETALESLRRRANAATATVLSANDSIIFREAEALA